MNLAKAIELNQESEKSLRDHKFIDHADAVKLGTEAMKREQARRNPRHYKIGYLLPGETEE